MILRRCLLFLFAMAVVRAALPWQHIARGQKLSRKLPKIVNNTQAAVTAPEPFEIAKPVISQKDEKKRRELREKAEKRTPEQDAEFKELTERAIVEKFRQAAKQGYATVETREQINDFARGQGPDSKWKPAISLVRAFLTSPLSARDLERLEKMERLNSKKALPEKFQGLYRQLKEQKRLNDEKAAYLRDHHDT